MPFVKLDCRILDSTLWLEREMREVFITALLMAEPFETTEPLPQLHIRSLENTGWVVPPGRYGLVEAAGLGILRRAGVTEEPGLAALERLGEPELSSRSQDFDGRRLIRVDGGFIVLNFMKYRDRDYTAAQRSARYRQRLTEQHSAPQQVRTSRRNVTAKRRDITQAEAEAEAEAKAEAEKELSNSKIKANSEVVAAKGGVGGNSTTSAAVSSTARSKRPIFTGTRFVVFEWQLDDLSRLLGKHIDEFHIDEWFHTLNQRCDKSGEVIPQRDGGKWLQEQTLAEARRRNLPIGGVSLDVISDKSKQNLAAMRGALNSINGGRV